MESVKRISVLWPVGPYGYGREQVVLASEFDRVSVENLALQQRLTVQDQREDDLKGLLQDVVDSCALIFQDHDATAETTDLHGRIESALNPTAEAESHEHVCSGCGSKGWTANCSECVPY